MGLRPSVAEVAHDVEAPFEVLASAVVLAAGERDRPQVGEAVGLRPSVAEVTRDVEAAPVVLAGVSVCALGDGDLAELVEDPRRPAVLLGRFEPVEGRPEVRLGLLVLPEIVQGPPHLQFAPRPVDRSVGVAGQRQTRLGPVDGLVVLASFRGHAGQAEQPLDRLVRRRRQPLERALGAVVEPAGEEHPTEPDGPFGDDGVRTRPGEDDAVVVAGPEQRRQLRALFPECVDRLGGLVGPPPGVVGDGGERPPAAAVVGDGLALGRRVGESQQRGDAPPEPLGGPRFVPGFEEVREKRHRPRLVDRPVGTVPPREQDPALQAVERRVDGR